MKKTLTALCLLGVLTLQAQQNNSLLSQDFWRNNPTIEELKMAIDKGNSPTETNAMHMDPATLAINSNASADIIKLLLSQKGIDLNRPLHEQRTYLHWATMRGNTEVISYLISKGANIHQKDDHELTPLALALNAGTCKKEIIELYFKAGLNPQTSYADGANLLLMVAPYDKDMELTNYLLSKGISLQSKDTNGATAADYAARKGNIGMIQALQQKGVKLTNNALLMAAQGTRRDANTVDVFNYLIDGQKLSPAVKDKEGNTLLQLVAKKQKQEEVAAYLISKGVPVNAATANGETALTMAMAYGSSSMVALLLDNKADINVVDKKGYNLTHYLMQSFRAAGSRGGMRGGPGAPPAGMAPNNGSPAKDEFAEKMKILQDRNFNLIASQKDGSTILHYAATAGDLALVKKVVAMGVSLNAQNDDGMTALVKAASTAKDDKVLRYLVEAGADKTLKTSFDESAYDLVKNNENFKKNNIDIEFLK